MFSAAARVVDFDDEKYQIERARSQMEKGQSVKCPRCNSTNTKFCYYSNYSLQQPRYFCKTCRSYWTEGVSLRNVLVGSVFRKKKRSLSSASASASASPSASTSSSEIFLKSMARKRIAHRTAASGSSASPAEYVADCISAKSESESPNAVRTHPCAGKKPLFLLFFNITENKQHSVDGGSGNQHSNSALRITPSQTTFTPMVPGLTDIDPQHLRGLSSAAKNNKQQGAIILVINDGIGSSLENNDGTGTHGVTIIDSGAAVHASGNISLFTQLGPEPPETNIVGANRETMLCFGRGDIRIPSLGLELKDVYYVPCMGNKTIVSVAKLNELGYSVNFSPASRSIRDERTWTRKLVGEARNVEGQFELDYLNIPFNRAPAVSDGTFTSLWRAALSRWSSFTKSLVQRHITPSSERLPQ